MGKTFAKIYLASTDDHPPKVNDKIKGWVENAGGHFSLDITPGTTHLLASKKSLKSKNGIIIEAQARPNIKIVRFAWLEDSLIQPSRKPKPTTGYEWDRCLFPVPPSKLSNTKRRAGTRKSSSNTKGEVGSQGEESESTDHVQDTKNVKGKKKRRRFPKNEWNMEILAQEAIRRYDSGNSSSGTADGGDNSNVEKSDDAATDRPTKKAKCCPPPSRLSRPHAKLTSEQKAQRKRQGKIRAIRDAGAAFEHECAEFEMQMAQDGYRIYRSPTGLRYSFNLVRRDIVREIQEQMAAAGLADVERPEIHRLQVSCLCSSPYATPDLLCSVCRPALLSSTGGAGLAGISPREDDTSCSSGASGTGVSSTGDDGGEESRLRKPSSSRVTLINLPPSLPFAANPIISTRLPNHLRFGPRNPSLRVRIPDPWAYCFQLYERKPKPHPSPSPAHSAVKRPEQPLSLLNSVLASIPTTYGLKNPATPAVDPVKAQLRRPSQFAVFTFHLDRAGRPTVNTVAPKGSGKSFAMDAWSKFVEKRTGMAWDWQTETQRANATRGVTELGTDGGKWYEIEPLCRHGDGTRRDEGDVGISATEAGETAQDIGMRGGPGQ